MFVVYVLYSPAFKKTYTGYTADLQKRLLSHNQLATKGFTIKFRPWVLIYSQPFETKTQAIKKEKELKMGKGRALIQNLIKEKYS
jgi:putative endonuclease